MLIQENESGEPKLVLDAAPYEKTKRIYEGLQRMGERLADQMEEADAEEREGKERKLGNGRKAVKTVSNIL